MRRVLLITTLTLATFGATTGTALAGEHHHTRQCSGVVVVCAGDELIRVGDVDVLGDQD